MNTDIKIYYYFTQIMTKDGDMKNFKKFFIFNKKSNLIQEIRGLRLDALKND